MDVKREFLNLDLSIIDSNNNIIFVIENKVKSIPYEEQLEYYNDKISDYNTKISKVNKQDNLQCVRVLLSLTEPTFDCAGEGWIWKSYDTVSEILKRQIDNIKDQYHSSIIKDYAGFAESLHTLVDEWGKDSYFLRDTKKCKVAQDLRIHDLYGKLHTQKLEQKLKEKLEGIGANKLNIDTYCSYQSSGPILEIKITGIGQAAAAASNQEAEAFVICVQGNQYRHGINAIEYTGNGNPQLPQNMCSLAQSNVSVKNSVKRIISKIGDWGFFMDPSQHPNNDTNYACINKNNRHIVKSGIRNNFCAFDLANKTGINQIYQYKKIDKRATIDDILNQMVDDVQAIIKQFP